MNLSILIILLFALIIILFSEIVEGYNNWTEREEFGFGNTKSMAWGDFNNDGYIDLAVGNTGNQQNYLYINNGNGTFNSIEEFGNYDAYSLAWGDYDNDNDLDLALGNHSGRNYLFENNGDGSFTKRWFLESDSTMSLAWGDYDNDNDLDLAVGNDYDEQNYLYVNKGDGTFTKKPRFGAGETSCIAWGDCNDDGYLDLAVQTDSDQLNYLYVNKKDGTFTERGEFGLINGYSIVWCDYNHDGKLDLIAGNIDGDNFVFKNEGNLIFAQIPEFGMGNTTSIAYSDYDNDEDWDFAIGNNDGQNYLYINEGYGNFTEKKLFGKRNTRCLVWGDFDNDNDLDLSAGNFNQQNYLYVSELPDFELTYHNIQIVPKSPEPNETVKLVTRIHDNNSKLSTLRNIEYLWHFDEGKNSTAYNAAKIENNGTLKNGTNWTIQSKFGRSAIEFNGKDSYISFSSISSMEIGCIEFWFKPKNNLTAFSKPMVFLENDANNSNLGDFLIGFNRNIENTNTSDGKVYFQLDSTGLEISTKTNNWSCEKFYHIAISWNDSEVKLYVNGTLEDSANSSIKIFNPSADIYLGAIVNNRTSSKNHFLGIIDELCISNKNFSVNQFYGLKYRIVNISYYNYTKSNNRTLIDNDTIMILGNSTSFAVVNWTAPFGLHKIFVEIDHENKIIERNESNNNATRIFVINPLKLNISYPDKWQNSSLSINLNLSIKGEYIDKIQLEYNKTKLVNGELKEWDGWKNAKEWNGSYPNQFNFSGENGYAYRFRFRVNESLSGNFTKWVYAFNDTGNYNTTKLDITKPVTGQVIGSKSTYDNSTLNVTLKDWYDLESDITNIKYQITNQTYIVINWTVLSGNQTDIYNDSITFGDGIYFFNISVKNLAGNWSDIVMSNSIILHTKLPECDISYYDGWQNDSLDFNIWMNVTGKYIDTIILEVNSTKLDKGEFTTWSDWTQEIEWKNSVPSSYEFKGENGYAYQFRLKANNSIMPEYSIAYANNTTKIDITESVTGVVIGPESTYDNSKLNVTLTDWYDLESDITNIKYQITNQSDIVINWTVLSGNQTDIYNDSITFGDGIYFFNISAKNLAGNWSDIVLSNSIILHTKLPDCDISYYDGWQNDSLDFNIWVNVTGKYIDTIILEVNSTKLDKGEFTTWSDWTQEIEWKSSVLSFYEFKGENGYAYQFRLKANNSIMPEYSIAYANNTTKIDITEPVTGVVIGPESTYENSKLNVTLKDWYDMESNITKIKYQITNETDLVIDWTILEGNSSEIYDNSMTFGDGIYYFNVSAQNGVSNWSDIVISNSIILHTKLPECNISYFNGWQNDSLNITIWMNVTGKYIDTITLAINSTKLKNGEFTTWSNWIIEKIWSNSVPLFYDFTCENGYAYQFELIANNSIIPWRTFAYANNTTKIDITEPVTGVVIGPESTYDNSKLNVTLTDWYDLESDITNIKYQITNQTDLVIDWTFLSGNQTDIYNDSITFGDGIYFFNISAKNLAGNWSEIIMSNSIILHTKLPDCDISYYDGWQNDSLNIKIWMNVTGKYIDTIILELNSTKLDKGEFTTWSNWIQIEEWKSSVPSSYEFKGENGYAYQFRLKVNNSIMPQWTIAYANNTTKLDITKPVTGVVIRPKSTYDNSKLNVTLKDWYDIESNITNFKYQITNQSGVVIDWTVLVGNLTDIYNDTMTFGDGIYYFNVSAKNLAGNWSEIIMSNSIILHTKLPDCDISYYDGWQNDSLNIKIWMNVTGKYIDTIILEVNSTELDNGELTTWSDWIQEEDWKSSVPSSYEFKGENGYAYKFRLKANNSIMLEYSIAYANNSTKIDITKPVTGVVIGPKSTYDNSKLNVTLKDWYDLESNITKIKYQITDQNGIVVDWIILEGNFSEIDNDSMTFGDGIYFFNVSALNGAGNWSEIIMSNSIILHTKLAECNISYFDGWQNNSLDIKIWMNVTGKYIDTILLEVNSTKLDDGDFSAWSDWTQEKEWVNSIPSFYDFIGENGYAYQFRLKANNSIMPQWTIAYANNTTKLDITKPVTGFVIGPKSTYDNSKLNVTLKDWYDLESNITNIKYQITNQTDIVIDWTVLAGNQTDIYNDSMTFGDGIYFFNVSAKNLAGKLSDIIMSNSIILHTILPECDISYYDSWQNDSLDFNIWMNVTGKYIDTIVLEVNSTKLDNGDFTAWSDWTQEKEWVNSVPSSYEFEGVNGYAYQFRLKANNSIMPEWNEWAYSQNVFKIDITSPTLEKIEVKSLTAYNTTLNCSIVNATDLESGIIKYWYSISNEKGEEIHSNEVDWLGGEITINAEMDMKFKDSIYYFNISVQNRAGNWSEIKQSSKITLYTKLPECEIFYKDGWKNNKLDFTVWMNITAEYLNSIELEVNSTKLNKGKFTTWNGWALEKKWTKPYPHEYIFLGENGYAYQFRMRAKNFISNKFGKWSSEDVKLNIIKIDTTPPTVGKIETPLETYNETSLNGKILDFLDTESDITIYQYRIIDEIENEIRGWTNTDEIIKATGLSLENGKSYFFIVRVKNGAENWSDELKSNIINFTLLPDLTFKSAKDFYFKKDGKNIDETEIRIGNIISIIVRIHNIGRGNATDIEITASLLSKESTYPLDPKYIDFLGPGENEEVELIWNVTDLQSDNYTIKIEIDAMNLIMEENEENNIIEKTIFIKPAIEDTKEKDSGIMKFALLGILICACIGGFLFFSFKKGASVVASAVIEDVFLLYKDGRLITHETRRLRPEIDEDVLGSMLTAVQEFVRDALKDEEHGTLGKLEYGKLQILLQSGKYLIIAVIISGEESKDTRKLLDQTIQDIEEKYAEILEDWNGVVGELSGTRKIIRESIIKKITNND